MQIRDRIKEFRRVEAAELKPNPKNWRTHGKDQQNALRSVLAEVGVAGAVIARELDDGSLMIIDGHLRTETLPDQLVPVLVLDVDEDEADILLATFDPIGSMASTDKEMVGELLDSISTNNEAVLDILNGLMGISDEVQLDRGEADEELRYQVIVECSDEDHQKDVLKNLHAEGYQCRLLIS